MSGWRVEGGREERRECEALSLLFKVQGPEKCSCPLSNHYNLQFSLVCHLQVCFSHTNAPIVATIKEQEGRMPDFKRSAPFSPCCLMVIAGPWCIHRWAKRLILVPSPVICLTLTSESECIFLTQYIHIDRCWSFLSSFFGVCLCLCLSLSLSLSVSQEE